MPDKNYFFKNGPYVSGDRKKSFVKVFILVLILLLFAMSILFVFTLMRGGEGVVLSFKPFTLQQLLHLDLELDIKSLSEEPTSNNLDRITARIEELKGIRFKQKPSFVEVSEKVLRLSLLEDFMEESRKEELEATRKLLAVLGLIPAGEDLEKTLVDVLTEQIIGTYNVKEKMITLVKGKELGKVMDELTVAHELAHALQDQYFNLEEAPLKNEEYTSDTDLAIESLVEGDAMMTMIEYAKRYIEPEALLKSQLESSEISSSKLERAPVYIRKSLLFPYESGLEFVTALVREGGNQKLNTAFMNPPLSTEQILMPEKYLARRDNPVSVKLEDISRHLNRGWKLIDEDTMGAFDLKVWFELYDGTASANEIADGWGGNAIQYYEGMRGNFVVLNRFSWDTIRDAEEFYTGFQRMVNKRFKGATSVKKRDFFTVFQTENQFVYCGISGNETLCIHTDIKALIDKALKAVPGFSM